MSNRNDRSSGSGQLSRAGVVIGVVGCVLLTASSVYTALKLGALPWPTIFTSIISLVLLRAFGHRDINDANVTQIVMSAGSMVAGGIAFTIPGIWMLGLDSQTSLWEMFFVALAGVLLGLVATALIRKRFVDESDLEYPVGMAAAQTLQASKAGGQTGKRLFGAMGIAGLYALLRDGLGVLPALLLPLGLPGMEMGIIYNSPMSLCMGFLVGGAPVLVWFIGALIGEVGIMACGTMAGLWDTVAATGIVRSLGMGLMMGSGVGVILHDLLPKILASARKGGNKGTGSGIADAWVRDTRVPLALMVAAAALLVCFGLDLGPLAAVVIVCLAFVTAIMSAQSVGQTGIDPMEIFGLIVLLLIAALGEHDQVRLFYVAGVIAVACGIGGDVMADFKTGAILGTDSKTMWKGQVLGALIGTVVASVTMFALLGAYGADAFGPGKTFVATQSSVVATMVTGIPNAPAFWIGLIGGTVLYCLGFPTMMLGLGVYLPFYMSFTGALGGLVKVVYDRLAKGRHADADAELSHEDTGIVVASGLLGGESIVGVIIAMVAVIAGLAG